MVVSSALPSLVTVQAAPVSASQEVGAGDADLGGEELSRSSRRAHWTIGRRILGRGRLAVARLEQHRDLLAGFGASPAR